MSKLRIPSYVSWPFLLCVLTLLGQMAQANSETNLVPVLQERAIMADTMRKASIAYNVPLPLLQAIAYEATGWRHLTPDPKGPGTMLAYGVMGIFNNKMYGFHMNRATELLGVDFETLKFDLSLNIMASAALLREIANQQEPIPIKEDLSTWYETIRRYSAYPVEAHQILYANRIFRRLAKGLEEPGLAIEIETSLSDYAKHSGETMQPHPDDYPGAIWLGPTPPGSFEPGRAGEDIEFLIVHSTEISALTAASWLTGPFSGVSVHYIIDDEGSILQILSEKDTSYGAGNLSFNRRAINIELAGWSKSPIQSWQTEAQLAALVELIRWLSERYDIPLDREHIIGHSEVPSVSDWCSNPEGWGGCSNHFDPGPYWSFSKLMRALGKQLEYQTVELNTSCIVTALPYDTAPKLTTLSQGHKFVSYDSLNGFHKLFIGGREDAQKRLLDEGEYHWDAWVNANCLNLDAAGDQLEVTETFPLLGLIRSGPYDSYPIVARSIDGERFVTTGNIRPDTKDLNLNWHEIYLTNGELGWIREDIVRLNPDLEAVETP